MKRLLIGLAVVLSFVASTIGTSTAAPASAPQRACSTWLAAAPAGAGTVLYNSCNNTITLTDYVADQVTVIAKVRWNNGFFVDTIYFGSVGGTVTYSLGSKNVYGFWPGVVFPYGNDPYVQLYWDYVPVR